MARPRKDSIRVPTPQRILDAAEAEFSQRGFAAARLSDVAEAAGIRRPSLLYHFPTKEALYEAVVERVFADMMAVLTEGMTLQGDFHVQLEAVVTGYRAFVDNRPTVAGIIIRELMHGSGPGTEIFMQRVAPVLDVVTHFISSAKEVTDGSPVRSAVLQVTATVLLRAASGSLREALWRGEDGDLELVRRMLVDVRDKEST